MYPVDTGYNSKDSGKLVGLGAHEAVVSAKSNEGGKEVRIHYPRWNFEIERVGRSKGRSKVDEKRGDFKATDHVG